YMVEDSKVTAKVVKTGISQNGFVEILSGLNVDQTVAVDGAAFLTDNIAVNVSNPS
ncbi:MAG: efflux RND transporter periplasmic adaptor subunit, partial [Nitrosomonadales bacterium]|nr:efflux RND transporter periplasmic adaptor subunit [Nitrosomonadales bacterium]